MTIIPAGNSSRPSFCRRVRWRLSNEYCKKARSQSGPIVVTKNGRAVAVLVCVSDDDDVEDIVLAHSQKLRKMLDEAERRIREGGGVSHDDMRTLVGQMP